MLTRLADEKARRVCPPSPQRNNGLIPEPRGSSLAKLARRAEASPSGSVPAIAMRGVFQFPRDNAKHQLPGA
jgi:hypothetical protein